MAIRALFFDLDDTLIDDAAAVRHGAEVLCATYAGDLPAGPDGGQRAGQRWQEAFDLFHPRFVRGEMSRDDQRRARIRHIFAAERMSDAEADARFAVWWDGYCAGTRLFPDVIPALDRCAHLPLGIITNGQGLTEGKLRAAGIRARFRVIIDPDAAGARKPEAAMFLAACRRMEVAPEHALHVGDHPDRDAQAAIRAGMQGCWLNRRGAAARADLPTITGLDGLSLR